MWGLEVVLSLLIVYVLIPVLIVSLVFGVIWFFQWILGQ